MYYPYKVVLTVYYPDGSSAVFEDFGTDEDKSLFVFTATRILNKMAKINDKNIVADGRIDYLPIENVPDKYKTSWPESIKTILVYYYSYRSAQAKR